MSSAVSGQSEGPDAIEDTDNRECNVVRMKYLDFLAKIVDDGIEAAKRDYEGMPDKLRGSVAGFEACRGKDPVALAKLLEEARGRTREATLKHVPGYREIRCFELEVEWTCNCVSATPRAAA